MPTDRDEVARPKVTAKEFAALYKLHDAYRELLSLGWCEPRYFRFPPNSVEFELIELGSTGIHRAIMHPDSKVAWVDYEWPSNPFLVRKIGGRE